MRNALSLLLSLLLVLTPASAWATCGARGFGTTFGVGSTDVVKSGYTTGLSTTITFFSRFWTNSSPAGARLIDQFYSPSVAAGFDIATGTTMGFSVPFTTTTGIWNWSTPSSNAWHSIALTYDASSTANNPIVYIDGSTVSVTRTTGPVGTRINTTSNYYIGNRQDGIKAWDGKIADMAIWNGAILTANEVTALAQGASPLQIRRASLSMYTPLCGLQANEPDWASRLTQTITGTKGASGPPDFGYPITKAGN